MIGDTLYDAEAARGAGTVAAGLLTGGFAREALTEAGCLVGLHQILFRGQRLLVRGANLEPNWPPTGAERTPRVWLDATGAKIRGGKWPIR
jgi:hypothetical protein